MLVRGARRLVLLQNGQLADKKLTTTFKLRRNYSDKCDQGRKGVVLGVYTDCDGKPTLTKAGCKFNERCGGKIEEMMKEATPIKAGMTMAINNIDPEFWGVCLAGIGRENMGYNEIENLDVGREQVRIAAAAGAVRLRKEGIQTIYIEDMDNFAEAAAEGAVLACWRFQENMHKNNWRLTPNLELYDSADTCGWTRGVFKAEAQNLARKLCDMPANQLNPTSFAQAAVDALCPCGVNVEVHDKDWIEDQDLNTLLMVAKGSCEPPVVLELSYCGGGSDKPVLLVGSGVTFDSGGIHLKKCHNMAKYRGAMAGAAVVVAAMRAAAAMSIPLNIQGIIPLCEHLPSGLAMKPGDVVQAQNGVHIMVQDCDKECRVMLADVMLYALKHHKPSLMVDVTCLSDSVRHVFGAGASGCWSNSKAMWTHIKKAGAYTGDRVWRMPLWKFYTKEIVHQSSVDITNHTRFHGDSCTGAAFLREFIEDVCWLHLDVTGVAFPITSPNLPYLRIGRMTGRPTRTIVQLLAQLACDQKSKKQSDCKEK